MGGALIALTNGLQAALLLARGRPDAMRFIEPSAAGAARSFWAAIVCLPAYLCLRLIDWAEGGAPLRLGHALGIDLLGYVIGWAGFAVLSHRLATMLGRGERWPRFIALWNWCNVAQYVLLVGAAIPQLLAAPLWVQQVAGLVALGWALWLEWYAARIALLVSRPTAAAMVAVDVLIGVMIAWVSSGLTPT
jgi:hypothetical protein